MPSPAPHTGQSVRLHEIAAHVRGSLVGPPDLAVTGVAGLAEAGPGDLSFATDATALKASGPTRATALLVPRHIESLTCAQIIVPNPALAMGQVVEEFFVRKRPLFGVSPLAHTGAYVTLGEGVSLWPFAMLEDHVSIGRGTTLYPGVFVGEGTTIGEDCLIYPNVTIREGVTIGNRVIIHAGTVVGSDGFGYVQDSGRHHKIPQIGTVVIEDDVELGANVTVDRATFGKTIIRRGTKVDNQVQIAHNVEVGEHNILVSQVGIAGSSKTGHHVIIGGQAGISDHVTIGDLVMIAARSGLNRDVPSKEVVAGTPAQPRLEWLKSMAIVAKLPNLRQQIREMEERLKALEARAAAKPAPSRKPKARKASPAEKPKGNRKRKR
jgi:UDP-3-O-[3-hydroxymyristoyl] glucosamine N-acyltransferase